MQSGFWMHSRKPASRGGDGFVPIKKCLLRPYGDEAVPTPFLESTLGEVQAPNSYGTAPAAREK